MARTATRSDLDIYRTVPLTGTPAKRDQDALVGALLPMELHTDDQFRAFIENRYIGARVHDAASEDEMINLYRVSIYGVKRVDFCIRTDNPDHRSVWLCLSDKGDTAEKWFLIATETSEGTSGAWYPVGDGAGGLVSDDDGNIIFAFLTEAELLA